MRRNTYELIVPDTAVNPAVLDDVACRSVDPELFFPVGTADWSPAKAVCEGCPQQANCLAYALATRQEGVWGGELLHLGRPVGAPRRWRPPVITVAA